MGRDVTGFRIDKKNLNMVNDKSNDSTSPEKAVEEQDVLGFESTNNESEEKKMGSPANPELRTANNGTIDSDSPKSAKKSQLNTQFMPRKQPNHKSYYDDEDNWSLASSTATSVRTKITVPVAPRLTCVDRLERRKEFYTKLEEKHKALEKERLEYEARIKEEEQAAIKQLRKNMVVKAKPVPSFYREGPPPKVELKKLPVTRAKSPNLTRRKSFGDATKPSPDDKGLCGRASRPSVGICKEGKASPTKKKASPVQKKASPTIKDARKLNGSAKNVKNQSTENSCVGDADIVVES